MAALSQLNAQVAAVAARTSPSERRMLAVLVVVLLAVGAWYGFSLAQTARDNNEAAQADLTNARKAARRAQGSGGVTSEIAARRADIRSWSWSAESADIGRVMIMGDIADMAEKAGLTDVEVKSDQTPKDAGEVKMAVVDLSAGFTWPGLTAFLTSLEASGHGFLIDSVIMSDDEKPKLKMSLRLPLSIQAPEPRGTAR